MVETGVKMRTNEAKTTSARRLSLTCLTVKLMLEWHGEKLTIVGDILRSN